MYGNTFVFTSFNPYSNGELNRAGLIDPMTKLGLREDVTDSGFHSKEVADEQITDPFFISLCIEMSYIQHIHITASPPPCTHTPLCRCTNLPLLSLL